MIFKILYNESDLIKNMGMDNTAKIRKEAAIAEAEAIDRKAEAMKKYGQAAIVEMLVKVLPEVAKKEATGIDMAEIVKAQTFEGQTTKNINFTGIPEKEKNK